jgi:hypothetical protein
VCPRAIPGNIKMIAPAIGPETVASRRSGSTVPGDPVPDLGARALEPVGCHAVAGGVFVPDAVYKQSHPGHSLLKQAAVKTPKLTEYDARNYR